MPVPRGTFACHARAIRAQRRRASTAVTPAAADTTTATTTPTASTAPPSYQLPFWRTSPEPVTKLGNAISGAMEWQTSAYAFNKQAIKPIPAVTTNVEKLLLNFVTMKQADNKAKAKDVRQARTALAARRKTADRVYISKPHIRDYGDRVHVQAFIWDGKAAAREDFDKRNQRFGGNNDKSGRKRGPSESDLILNSDEQVGLKSLLARMYGKQVHLNLIKISRPHLDADILSQYVAQRLRDRRFTPRRVIRDATWKAPLPSAQAVANIRTAKLQSTPQKFTWQDFTFGNAAQTNATSIVDGLGLSQVSSIQVEAAGRLTKRLTANRSAKKMARRGAASKGPAFMLRGFRKAHTHYAFASGKRRVGQFGIKVSVGHV